MSFSVLNSLKSAFLLVLLLCSTVWGQAGPRQIALTHVVVINPSETSPHPDATVLIAKDRIVEVGPSKTVKIPPGANVHDHASAIDIADLQARELGAAHAGAVEGHQNGAIEGRSRQTKDGGLVY